MRSTLFFIPHELAGIPLFGLGWALLLWVIGGGIWIAWLSLARPTANSQQPNAVSPNALFNEVFAGLPVLAIGALLILFVLPSIEQMIPGEPPIPLGLPIRGYGVMVLIGLLCGIGLTMRRARKFQLSDDLIISLGFWMMIGGVLGARIFYVIQKWDQEFANKGSFVEQLVAVVKLTEGGLVIYGGIFGGIFGGLAFCLRHHLPVRAMGDLIAPAFLIGYSFGRIGCLLNGCCYGGVCYENLPTIRFPQGSGPYTEQLMDASLLGVSVAPDNPQPDASGEAHRLPATVREVRPQSLAAAIGLSPGSHIDSIQPYLIPRPPGDDPAGPPYLEAVVSFDQQKVKIERQSLPDASLPVHPSQIYAAINAALLCWLIWRLQPVARRDGMTFLVAVLLYAVSRFVLEGIRSDELGQLGTSLTIAQWIAMLTALVVGLLMLCLSRIAPGRVWDWSAVSRAAG